MSAPAPGGATANVDAAEVAKFEAGASRFWDPQGEFRPLHLLNPVRTRFVSERVPLAGSRVLDVGCGGGLLAESLAREGAQVTAIDLAPAMIEVARLHAAAAGLTIDYRLAGAQELMRASPRPSKSSPAWRCSSTCPSPQRCSARSRSCSSPAARCSSRP